MLRLSSVHRVNRDFLSIREKGQTTPKLPSREAEDVNRRVRGSLRQQSSRVATVK